tara:strand:+ start:2597 stop:2812 length:216 start_codon:yes stop_codon:yes gene_type:complete
MIAKNNKNLFYFFLLAFLTIEEPLLAYIGPGLALGTILISLALVLVLIFVIIAILYYPIKKVLTKYKNKIK